MNIRTNFENFACSLEIDSVEAAPMDVPRTIRITRITPPAVIAAAIAIDARPANDSLFDDVIAIAKHMHWPIRNAERNPRSPEGRSRAQCPDFVTNRWPDRRSDQPIWAADLVTPSERLVDPMRVGFDPAGVIQSKSDDLSGGKAGETAPQACHRAQTVQVEHGVPGMTSEEQSRPALLTRDGGTPA
ncbi:hypothetical protein [Halodurantibacterium flavum]